jgi:hypothetical protein
VRRHGPNWLAASLVAMSCALAAPALAAAHVTRAVGPLRLSFGCGDEPAFTGSKNFVEVELTADGAPIADPRGELRAEVSFGDRRVELPLLPTERG